MFSSASYKCTRRCGGGGYRNTMVGPPAVSRFGILASHSPRQSHPHSSCHASFRCVRLRRDVVGVKSAHTPPRRSFIKLIRFARLMPCKKAYRIIQYYFQQSISGDFSKQNKFVLFFLCPTKPNLPRKMLEPSRCIEILH